MDAALTLINTSQELQRDQERVAQQMTEVTAKQAATTEAMKSIDKELKTAHTTLKGTKAAWNQAMETEKALEMEVQSLCNLLASFSVSVVSQSGELRQLLPRGALQPSAFVNVAAPATTKLVGIDTDVSATPNAAAAAAAVEAKANAGGKSESAQQAEPLTQRRQRLVSLLSAIAAAHAEATEAAAALPEIEAAAVAAEAEAAAAALAAKHEAEEARKAEAAVAEKQKMIAILEATASTKSAVAAHSTEMVNLERASLAKKQIELAARKKEDAKRLSTAAGVKATIAMEVEAVKAKLAADQAGIVAKTAQIAQLHEQRQQLDAEEHKLKPLVVTLEAEIGTKRAKLASDTEEVETIQTLLETTAAENDRLGDFVADKFEAAKVKESNATRTRAAAQDALATARAALGEAVAEAQRCSDELLAALKTRTVAPDSLIDLDLSANTATLSHTEAEVLLAQAGEMLKALISRDENEGGQPLPVVVKLAELEQAAAAAPAFDELLVSIQSADSSDKDAVAMIRKIAADAAALKQAAEATASVASQLATATADMQTAGAALEKAKSRHAGAKLTFQAEVEALKAKIKQEIDEAEKAEAANCQTEAAQYKASLEAVAIAGPHAELTDALQAFVAVAVVFNETAKTLYLNQLTAQGMACAQPLLYTPTSIEAFKVVMMKNVEGKLAEAVAVVPSASRAADASANAKGGGKANKGKAAAPAATPVALGLAALSRAALKEHMVEKAVADADPAAVLSLAPQAVPAPAAVVDEITTDAAVPMIGIAGKGEAEADATAAAVASAAGKHKTPARKAISAADAESDIASASASATAPGARSATGGKHKQARRS